MILKKYQAKKLRPSGSTAASAEYDLYSRRSDSTRSEGSASQDSATYMSASGELTYDRPLSEDLFETGMLQDRRRRNDRRDDFRRDTDHILISRAEEEAHFIKERARKEGFAEGLAQSEEAILRLKHTIEDLLLARDTALQSASDDIASIAIDVAKHILNAEISCDPNLRKAFVTRAIREAGKEHKSIKVRVHPGDKLALETAFEEKSPVMADVALTLQDDSSVDPGSCIIETVAGQVDKRFSTQLELLAKLVSMTTSED